MLTLIIMIVGILVGRMLPSKCKKVNETIQLLSTLLLIFTMGLGLGNQNDFFSELSKLGIQSFLFFLFPSICSVAIVYVLTIRLLPDVKDASRSPLFKNSGKSERRKYDPTMILTIAALLCGIACGSIAPLSDLLSPLRDHSDWILYLLMFSVGISVGWQRGVLTRLRQYHIKILLVPIGTVIGSFVGGLICGAILKYPLNVSVSITEGLGWYSLSGVTISDLAGSSIGSIAFLSNLMREIASFITIPFIAKHFNSYSCIAMAAATSEDTTLPMIVRYTNEETAIFSVINGMICSTLVPIIISLCY